WLSTFHSLCARLLRREAAAAQLPKDFAIYDTDDQLAAVKLAMAKLNIDSETLTPRNVLSAISNAKNHAVTPEKLKAEAIGGDTPNAGDISAEYKRQLKPRNALDFAALLLRTAQMLPLNPPVREKWQNRFQYLHVDEYQDTNRVQYDLMRLLTNAKQ